MDQPDAPPVSGLFDCIDESFKTAVINFSNFHEAYKENGFLEEAQSVFRNGIFTSPGPEGSGRLIQFNGFEYSGSGSTDMYHQGKYLKQSSLDLDIFTHGRYSSSTDTVSFSDCDEDMKNLYAEFIKFSKESLFAQQDNGPLFMCTLTVPNTSSSTKYFRVENVSSEVWVVGLTHSLYILYFEWSNRITPSEKKGYTIFRFKIKCVTVDNNLKNTHELYSMTNNLLVRSGFFSLGELQRPSWKVVFDCNTDDKRSAFGMGLQERNAQRSPVYTLPPELARYIVDTGSSMYIKYDRMEEFLKEFYSNRKNKVESQEDIDRRLAYIRTSAQFFLCMGCGGRVVFPLDIGVKELDFGAKNKTPYEIPPRISRQISILQ
jgi:hypothetical protein